MSKYHVFLGAPRLDDMDKDVSSYSWKTVSSGKHILTQNCTQGSQSQSTPVASIPAAGHNEQEVTMEGAQPLSFANTAQLSAIFPFDLATLEAASQKISMLYKDVVFLEEDVNEPMALEEVIADQSSGSQRVAIQFKSTSSASISTPFGSEEVPSRGNGEKEVEVSVFRGVGKSVEQTTVYTWPLTEERSSRIDDSKSSQSSMVPSFLLPSQDLPSSSLVAQSPLQTPLETQTQPESQSFGVDSFASSIGRFPSFHFNPHVLTSLTSLTAQAKSTNGRITRKVNGLLAALELEGPESITIKKGVDAGKEVSILKMILGDEEGEVCKLTAWREIADDWGGNGKMIGPKRGDILFIENVTATCEPKAATTLSASSYLKSSITICYRTMPYAHEDGSLRPDLRLGCSEPCVRKVAGVVRWFEEMAGLTE